MAAPTRGNREERELVDTIEGVRGLLGTRHSIIGTWSTEAASLWSWFEGLTVEERGAAVCLHSPVAVAMVELAVTTGANAPQEPLFEWSWLEHQHTSLTRRAQRDSTRQPSDLQ